MSQPVCREYKKMTTYIHITSEYEANAPFVSWHPYKVKKKL